VEPRFDPSTVTHIVTEATAATTLRALGVKKLVDIPQHIPTVKWTWVTLGIKYASRLPKDEIDDKLRQYLFQHGAFAERLDAGPDYIPKASVSVNDHRNSVVEEGISRISYVITNPLAQDALTLIAESSRKTEGRAPLPSMPPALPVPSHLRMKAPRCSHHRRSPLNLARMHKLRHLESSWIRIHCSTSMN